MNVRKFALTLLAPLLLAGEVSAAESAGLIAEGTPWETPYYIIDSGIEGPAVLVIGGLHGDQPAGHRAAEQIRRWPIAKGKLIVIPAANLRGLKVKRRSIPGVAEAERDLNRNFAISAKGEVKPKGKLADSIWNLVANEKPDWVIDFHEGMNFHVSHKPAKGKRRSVGSTIIYRENKEIAPFVERALTAVNTTISDPERKFEILTSGSVRHGIARTAAEALGANYIVPLSTSGEQMLSLRTRQLRTVANSLLNDMGVIDRNCVELLSGGTEQEPLQVAFFDGPGTGPSGHNNIPRILDGAEGIDLHYLGPDDIKQEALRQFDVVLFPGGSGSKQAKAIGEDRREFVREYIRGGGGCIGICAGAFLCSSHFSWSLDIVDSSVFTGTREIEGEGKKQMWFRGYGADIELELTDTGKKVFTQVPPKFEVHYQNGPIISRHEAEKLDDYTPLAWFRTEQVRYEPQRGTMVNTPAIVSGRFGEGRVISISPHPEMDRSLESMIVNAVHWVTGREPLKPEKSTSEVEMNGINEVVRKFFPRGAKGGLAVLVTKENEILHCKGYGKKNGKAPITPNTPMGLASVTKQFAAMCAAMLIEEGKLKMTDKVSDYLPDLEFQNPGRELLIQDLVWHISGLPNFIKKAERESITAYKIKHGLKNLNNQTHAEWLSTLPLRRKPGTEFEYTNSGYVLLCRIIEVITEKPFHEFQEERIFDLLEMDDTTDSTRFNGSGNMSTTLLDYAKWDRALWNHILLNDETSELYFTSGELDNGGRIEYAMGWRVEYEGDKLVRVSHGGTGSPPGNSRNMISRNLKNRTTVAFFARENTSFNKARKAEFIEALETYLANQLD